MFTFFIRFFILFLALTGAIALIAQSTQRLEFGNQNFWDVRGIFFLFFIMVFPRLTLLFSSVAFGGIFWWIGFFFAPRILVSFLATLAYWNTNPILVTLSWIFALSAEPFEKSFLRRRIFIKTIRPSQSRNQGGFRYSYTTSRSTNTRSRNLNEKEVIDVKSEVK